MVRLTKENRKKLLEQNEGFTQRTFNDQRNFEETRIYKIKDGLLHIREIGKTSWADSRYEDEWIASDKERVADDEETHRFLYKWLRKLNKDGLD